MDEDVELHSAVFRRAFDEVHISEAMRTEGMRNCTNSDPPPEPDPEPLVYFAPGNAAPLPTESLIIALLVAFHVLDDHELDGWCQDVLVQERQWSEVHAAHRVVLPVCCVCYVPTVCAGRG